MKGFLRSAAVIAFLLFLASSQAAFAQLTFDTPVNYEMNTVDLGNGKTFTLNNPNSIAVGDFDGDGKLDMAVLNGLPVKFLSPDTNFHFFLSVFLGNGDGTFQEPKLREIGDPLTCPSNTKNIATCDHGSFVIKGDFDEDGNDDLAIVYFGKPTGNSPTPGKIGIFLSNGDGTFADPTFIPVGLGAARAITGRFTNSGEHLDIAVTNQEENSVSILLGDGHGNFTAHNCGGVGTGGACTDGIGKKPAALAAGNFDSDDKVDLAVVNVTDGTVTILKGEGNGDFAPYGTPTETAVLVGVQPIAIIAADFNRDGNTDLAVMDQQTKSIAMLLGNGDGSFEVFKKRLLLGKIPVDMVADDFNGDGVLDLAFVFFPGKLGGVFPGIGDGNFDKNVFVIKTNGGGIGSFAIASGQFIVIDRNAGGGTSTLSRSGDSGNGVTFTINGGTATFVASDVGRTIISGTGRALIQTFTDSTHVIADVLQSFAADPEPISAGSWFLSSNKPDIAIGNGKVAILLNGTTFPDPSASLDVTFPDGGETLTAGSQQTILWNSSNFPTGNVKIDLLYQDSGGNPVVKSISSKGAPNSGSFLWKVPKTPTTTARIRVCSILYPGICGTSDADFTIQ